MKLWSWYKYITIAALMLSLVGCLNTGSLKKTDKAHVYREKPNKIQVYRKAPEKGNAFTQKAPDLRYFLYGAVTHPRLYRKTAEQGDAFSQNELGLGYFYGRGVPNKDDIEAVRWFRKAADQDYAPAQENLGLSYFYGIGVPNKNEVEAVRWFRKAAAQGEAKAQFYLGVSYLRGQAVPQDTVEAIRWFRMAAELRNRQAMLTLSSFDEFAEHGEAKAQFALGFSYFQGIGVQQDTDEAFQSLMQMAGAKENTKGNMEELRAENYEADVGDNVKRYMEALRTENYEAAAAQLMYPLNITHAEKEQKLAGLVKKIKETNVMLGSISDTDSTDMPTGISQNYYVSMIPLKDHPGVFAGITIPVVFTKAGAGVLAFMIGAIDGRQGLYEVQYWCFTCAVKKSK